MKHIAIGPGALGYFALLGALDKLHVDGKLSELESISGASAGALVACMVIYTKFDFREILKMSMKVPVSKLKPQIKNLFHSYGLVSQETTREMIMDVIRPITFAELYELNPIKLHVAAFCVELNKTSYFSVDTTPTMSIIDALCMSIAVPFMFASFKYGPWNYFDGGIVESSPCGHLIGQKNEDVLILRLIYKDIYNVNNFTDYISFVFNTYLKMRHVYSFPTLYIDLSGSNVLDFGISDNVKLAFYLKGYNYFHS